MSLGEWQSMAHVPGSLYPRGRLRSSWLWPGPQPVIAAVKGTNQQMEAQTLSPILSVTWTFKSFLKRGGKEEEEEEKKKAISISSVSRIKFQQDS